MAAMTGTRWEIEIKGFVPPSVNVLLSRHWARRSRLKRAVADTIALARHMAPRHIPDAVRKRRVSVAVTVSGRGGLPDPGNVLKVLEDALVANRLIVDDSAAHYEIGDVRVERGKTTGTVVILEEVR